MSLRACCTALLALLWGCDPDVLIGYAHAVKPATDAGATRDSGRDAGGAAADSGSDASGPSDAGDFDAAVYVPPQITWVSGAHSGNDFAMYTAFGMFRSRDLALAAVYPDRKSWTGIVAPGWPVDLFKTFPGRLLLNEPLYPEGGMGNNQDCAAGMYNTQWSQLGKFLVDHQRADSIIRLGWGWNDQTHAWKADTDLTDWISCYRQVVGAIRSMDSQVLFDWSFNAPGAPYVRSGDPYAAYPGDAYVDFVGLEVFDDYPPTYDSAAWIAKCNGPGGLCTLTQFARKHSKKVGIAEWGVVSCGAANNSDMGADNPYFVRKVVETFADNADIMGYEAYFEDGNLEVCSDISTSGNKNPKAAAEYRLIYQKR